MHLYFLVIAKVCAKVFIKKEVVCLFLAFIDNIFFSITPPSNSVNMTLSVEKTDMRFTFFCLVYTRQLVKIKKMLPP